MKYILLLLIVTILLFYIKSTNKKTDKLSILNLVLYSRDDSYDKMKNITSKYYKNFDYVHTYYYCYDSNLEQDYLLKDNILYIKGIETYTPGILQKTISALEYFKNDIPNYSYIVRSNISTIIRFDILEKSLRENPVEYGCALC